MAKFITEDDIEQAILEKLKQQPFNYDIIICDSDPAKRDDLNDGTGRLSKKEMCSFLLLCLNRYKD